MSDVSLGPTWSNTHSNIYRRLSEALAAEPPKPPISAFLTDRLPGLLKDCHGPAHGYVVDGKTATYRIVSEGEPAFYWTGDDFEVRPFSERDFFVGDYLACAAKIKTMTRRQDTLVIDIGAGACLQTVALRGEGSELPVLNLDYFEAEIGRYICKHLSIENVMFGRVDLNAAMATAESSAALKGTILDIAAGRPILILTRMALFGFAAKDEYERTLSFFIDDVGASAGVHMEFSGHTTPTYRKICDMWGRTMEVSSKAISGDGDPLSYLEGRADIRVDERREILAGPLTKRFMSFLSWRR